eukprot:TRINITY_DN111049_c0_g1_i1.p1 TRINITY_DN111049_c0_g1~~TRINITY_DN111049_c0_g1_i1.p1  ORF type:complete len:387 (+),score=58.93 TRINITY_DN111049_c0_g1_i1:94-1254(+)
MISIFIVLVVPSWALRLGESDYDNSSLALSLADSSYGFSSATTLAAPGGCEEHGFAEACCICRPYSMVKTCMLPRTQVAPEMLHVNTSVSNKVCCEWWQKGDKLPDKGWKSATCLGVSKYLIKTGKICAMAFAEIQDGGNKSEELVPVVREKKSSVKRAKQWVEKKTKALYTGVITRMPVLDPKASWADKKQKLKDIFSSSKNWWTLVKLAASITLAVVAASCPPCAGGLAAVAIPWLVFKTMIDVGFNLRANKSISYTAGRAVAAVVMGPILSVTGLDADTTVDFIADLFDSSTDISETLKDLCADMTTSLSSKSGLDAVEPEKVTLIITEKERVILQKKGASAAVLSFIDAHTTGGMAMLTCGTVGVPSLGGALDEPKVRKSCL